MVSQVVWEDVAGPGTLKLRPPYVDSLTGWTASWLATVAYFVTRLSH